MEKKERVELAETLSQVLDTHRGVDAETHKKHHEFIDQCLIDKRERMAMWRGVRKQVLGWSIIVMITGAGYAVADWFQHVLRVK